MSRAYSFTRVGEKILSKLAQKVGSVSCYDLVDTYVVDGVQFKLEKPSALDQLLAMVVFHKVLYHPYGVSGDVRPYRILAPVKETKNGWVMLAIMVTPRADNMAFQEAKDLGGDLLRYYAKRTYSYSASAVVIIVCIVREQILYEEMRRFIDEEEKEIAKSVMVAARLSKSLSRALVPIVDLVGNRIVDYATVGYEDVMFIEIMRYLLARLHFRKSNEVNRGEER